MPRLVFFLYFIAALTAIYCSMRDTKATRVTLIPMRQVLHQHNMAMATHTPTQDTHNQRNNTGHEQTTE